MCIARICVQLSFSGQNHFVAGIMVTDLSRYRIRKVKCSVLNLHVICQYGMFSNCIVLLTDSGLSHMEAVAQRTDYNISAKIIQARAVA